MPRSNFARRIALLATSSFGVAAIASAASLSVAFAPAAALAANECGNPSTNGATADQLNCPVGTYATGVQHTSNGDLTVTVNTRTTSSSTLSNFGTGGVVSTAGVAGDDLTLRLLSPVAMSSASFNTAFPALLNAESQSGDVLVEVQVAGSTSGGATISANNAATTRAIRAVSTAGGDVTVRNLGLGSSGDRSVTIQSNVNANAVAIEARSSGGGDVAVDLGIGTGAGRLYGILAQADGAGTVQVSGSGTANNSVAGSAGLRVLAGTGQVTVTGGSQFNRPIAFSGQTGVYIDSDGDVDFTGAALGSVYGIDLVNVAAGRTATLNLVGGGDAFTTGAVGTTAAVRAAGDGEVIVNILGIQRTMNFDFHGMAASVEVDVKSGGAWMLGNSASAVPDGNFSINIEAGGAFITGEPVSGNDTLEPATTVTFDPAVVLRNAGTIVIGPDDRSTGWVPGRMEAELRLVGLEAFHHSGSILLGSCGQPCSDRPGNVAVQRASTVFTDASYDDLLVFQDGTWIGEGGRIVFDADITRTQTDCVRAAVTNSFTAADCVRIVDSTVEGVTYLNIVHPFSGDRGRLTQEIMDEGIVLIETPGSTVTAGNFALDPAMDGYNPASGSLDKGLFQYVLLFDETAEQFKLFGTLSGAAYQLPMAATAAQGLWRLSTGSWFERQADLRGGVDDGIGGGVWLRASGEQADRDVVTIATLGGLPFAVDNTNTVKSYAVTGGLDLVSASGEEMGYVVGLMAGYAHADVEYGPAGNTQAMDGWTGGVYASYFSGGLFVDAVINANNVILDTDAPGFGFFPEETILSSRLISVGGQVEAGWRLPIGEGLFAEPLASVTYVRSKLEDLQISPDDFSRPGLAVSYDDPTSLRAGLGGRVGMDRDFGTVRTQVSLLGRMWNEFEGENSALIENLAFAADPGLTVTDDFSGQFNELALGASVWSPGGIVSGFLQLGGKFGEDYEARNGSIGVRVAW